MESKYNVYKGEELIVLTAKGTMDFDKSKATIEKIVSNPEYNSQFEILMDLRDIECDMDTVEIFDLAAYMAWPDPALPTSKRIAVVVSGNRAFDNAKFLELCASNRSLGIKAFTDYEEAENWLNATI